MTCVVSGTPGSPWLRAVKHGYFNDVIRLALHPSLFHMLVNIPEYHDACVSGMGGSRGWQWERELGGLYFLTNLILKTDPALLEATLVGEMLKTNRPAQ